MSASDYDQALIGQMQEELVSLLTAWIDRGINPGDAAMMLLATSNLLVIKLTSITFGETIQALLPQWEKHGGKF